MKIVRLTGWLALSLLIGKSLDVLAAPSTSIYSAFLYTLPIIILGVQREIVVTYRSLNLLGSRIQIESVTEEWQTFWGIRFGMSKEIEREVSWFPGNDWKNLANGVISILGNVTPLILSGLSPSSLRRLKNE